MWGARPLYLSARFHPRRRIAARHAQTRRRIHASGGGGRRRAHPGDTKVVDKGRCDGLYINTSGIGVIEHRLHIAPSSVCIGDNLISERRYRPARHGRDGRT
ncbi:MAG: hypothetical protein IPK52_26895 [Chloroflexi bacterium]|nr:hypothetical protein [Chloroflexota bacterium]